MRKIVSELRKTVAGIYSINRGGDEPLKNTMDQQKDRPANCILR
jgi:hypothetical protein